MDVLKMAQTLSARLKTTPDVALILGSGLGALADKIEDAQVVPYSEIPGFPVSTAPGHAGKFVAGRVSGKNVIAMSGRVHYYEGYDMKDVVAPVQVMRLCGAKTLIVTNAAGGVNLSFKPGDLMVISDHIKLAWDNPLRGKNDEELGVRFPDMSCAYSKELRSLARDVAKRQGIALREGVYCYMSGPSYETPAEIRAVRALGGDAVGMSTAPEVVAASHARMRVLGISCISNMAAGILDKPLTEEEVLDTAAKVKNEFCALILGVLKEMEL